MDYEYEKEMNIKRAIWNSMNEYKAGESSKQSENLERAVNIEQQSYKELYDEYLETKKDYTETVRAYNDIMHAIEEQGDNMDPDYKETLLNESIKLRSLVDQFSNHAQSLKDELNLPSSEEEYSSDNSNSGNSSDGNNNEYSSDEEPRPSKRPRR